MDFIGSSPVVLVYHAYCPDGSACLTVLKEVLGDQIKATIAYSYGRNLAKFQELDGPDVVFLVCDLSVPDRFGLPLKGRFMLIDHHYSSIKKYNPFLCESIKDNLAAAQVASHVYRDERTYININSGYCAAMLVAKIFKFEGMKEYLSMVNSIDLWKAEDMRTDSITQKLYVAGFTPAFRLSGTNGDYQRAEAMSAEVSILNLTYQQMINNIKGRKLFGYNVAVLPMPKYANLMFNHLKARPNLDILILYSFYGRNIKLSWRSAKVNVAEICEKYDGGGHFSAASCIMTKEQFEEIFGK